MKPGGLTHSLNSRVLFVLFCFYRIIIFCPMKEEADFQRNKEELIIFPFVYYKEYILSSQLFCKSIFYSEEEKPSQKLVFQQQKYNTRGIFQGFGIYQCIYFTLK